jgi:hypothetical protein
MKVKVMYLLNMLVRLTIFLAAFLPALSLQASAKPVNDKPLVIAVISEGSRSDYEQKWQPLLAEQLKSCAACSVKNVTPYTTDGNVDEAALPAAIEQVPKESTQFLFFNWNAISNAGNKPVLEALKKLTATGYLVIAKAGIAKATEPTMPLSRTVNGQVPDIVIIGELTEKERLLARSYFGPEMLTALKPPKDYVGQGYSSLFFVSKLATSWNRKSASADWLSSFKSTKSRSRKLWPDLGDFFGR